MAAAAEPVEISLYWRDGYKWNTIDQRRHCQQWFISSVMIQTNLALTLEAKVNSDEYALRRQHLPVEICQLTAQGPNKESLQVRDSLRMRADTANTIKLFAKVFQTYDDVLSKKERTRYQQVPIETYPKKLQFEEGKKYDCEIRIEKEHMRHIDTFSATIFEKREALPEPEPENFEGNPLVGFVKMALHATGAIQDASLDDLDVETLFVKLKEAQERLSLARTNFDDACHFGNPELIQAAMLAKQKVMTEVGSLNVALAKKGHPQPEEMPAGCVQQ